MSEPTKTTAKKRSPGRASVQDSALRRTAVNAHQSFQPEVNFSQQGHFEHDFSAVQVQHHAPTTPQAKLTIGQPGDQYEREAEHVAETVMLMPNTNQVTPQSVGAAPTGTLRRQADEEQEKSRNLVASSLAPTLTSPGRRQKRHDEDELIQRKESSAALSTAHDQAAPPIVHDVLHAPGRTLDTSTRTFMESRFGHDFSGVRVHTDEQAAEAARSVRALAYTVGRDVVFGAGQYAPGTMAGKRLLAHELTHVLQQQLFSSYILARQTVTQHEMTPVTTPEGENIEKNIEKLAGETYWERRIGEVYQLNFVDPVGGRFKANPEERDAVLSTLWNVRPTGRLTGKITRNVSIPALARAKASKTPTTLLYQFTFKPKSSAKDQDSVEVSFVAEGGAAEATSAPSPPPDYNPPGLPYSYQGFAEKENPDDYWQKYPDEQKQLFNWIEHSASQSFEQVVTTSANVPRGKKTVTHTSTFAVKGAKDAQGNVTSLSIRLIGSPPTKQEKLPPDYNSKDIADLFVEKAQTTPDPKKGDLLGNIAGLKLVPPDELLSVKFVVEEYFHSGTRNAEVDPIIPIAGSGKEVFYSLHFQAGTRPKTVDVDVTRVGEKGTTTPGKIDPTRLDLTRVKGYAENSTGIAKLQSWLKKRYPGSSISGSTVQEITQNMNTFIQSNVEAPAWFSKNYSIQILDDTSGEARLRTAHGFKPDQLVDIKTFEPNELRMLELALETFSDALLPMLSNVQMVRQKIAIEKQKDGTFRQNRETTGLTQQDGAEKTVIIFDGAFTSDNFLFLGSGGNVLPFNVATYTHEFGHVVTFSSPDVEKAFKDFVKKKRIQPVTKYAASKPKEDFPEAFPEAFALYNTDPKWMHDNLPDLFDWFEKLSKSGKAPPP